LEAILNAAWLTVVVVGALTIALKALGPVAIGGRTLPPRVLGVVDLLAPAVLAALVVTSIFAADEELVVDERAVGLAAAGAALVLRLPILAVIVIAAAATALARALV
jgi:branched-subunit amino acid transport protein